MQNDLPVCRSCGRAGLKLILSLGRTPLANALLASSQLGQAEPTYPLDLVFCPHCALVQITETVPPEVLFRDYLYFSSNSDAMLHHAQQLVEQTIRTRRLAGGSLVIEVASNDGYLLQYYKQAGIAVLGVEPAVNVAKVAQERGIPTVCEFFGEKLAEQLRDQNRFADVIHAHNVLAHVSDLNGFVRGICVLLQKDGVAVIEAPYVKDLIDHVEFDTIYHEHLCYFSLTALDRLFQRHGLNIQDVERVPIHGGSLRLFVGGRRQSTAHVQSLLAEEAAWGVDQLAFYQGFGARVEKLRGNLVSLLRDLKAQGRRIAAYGASAKGSTLLNYFGIGRETLDFVVDRSRVKQGHYTPGTRLPIYAPEELLQARPDYVLLLTWNFAEEILGQQAAYREQGGKFIIPIPELKVV
jgi:SAM-dependent methyltransferase